MVDLPTSSASLPSLPLSASSASSSHGEETVLPPFPSSAGSFPAPNVDEVVHIPGVTDDRFSELEAGASTDHSHADSRVLILNTGGTLSMQRDPESGRYVPKANFLESYIRNHPSFTSQTLPSFHVYEYSPLLDSSDVNATQWIQLARDVERHYADYDGFVILHGTDTLAYSATALSFALCNLAKPVIVTGAQIPIQQPINDAVQNLAGALFIAGNFDICEVCVFFHNNLMRGNRVSKIDNWGVHEAFSSPAFPCLGRMGLEFELNTSILQHPPKGRLRISGVFSSLVSVLHMVPGFSDHILANMLQPPLRGLVLRTYGSGNMPREPSLISAIASAVKRGVVVVVTSQCIRGRVDLERYQTSKALVEAGAISGYDMTVEAAAVKLSYLIGKGLDPSVIRQAMQKDLRGEMSFKPQAVARSYLSRL